MDGIAGGSGDVGDDIPFFADQGVDEGGFAHIGAAHDGQPGQALFGILLSHGGQHLYHAVEDFTCATARHGRHRVDLAQSQGIELLGVGQTQVVVDFVDHQHHLLVAAAQNHRHRLIKVGDARFHVHHEKNDVGLIKGQVDLLADLLLKHIVGIDHVASRVDHREISTVPGALAINPVAGHPRHIIDDGLARFHKPVEKRRLTHIGAPDYRYYPAHIQFSG